MTAPIHERRGLLAGRPDLWVPILLALVAFMYAVSAIEPLPVGVFQDDGMYVVLAKSLATGEGYRYLNIPGTPNATHYPPLYPAFLALLWKVGPAFPGNIVVFKFANAVLTALAAALVFLFARRRVRLEILPAALATVAFTACAPVVLLTVMVLSEPLFLVGLLLALFAAERVADEPTARHALVAGAAAGLLALVRTLGVVVVPATVLVLAWRRQWKAAALMVGAALLVMLPWQLWVSANADALPAVLQGKYGSYTGWLADGFRDGGLPWLARLVWFNLYQLSAQGWATVTVESMPPIRWVATAALIALFGLGWYQLVRRTPVTAWMVAGYLTLVVAWPFVPARFVFGIWPLVGFVFVLAIQRILGLRASRRWAPVAWTAAAAVFLLSVGYVRYNYRGTTRGWWTQLQRLSSDRSIPIAEWVEANTSPNDVLMADDELLLHLYTGRLAIPASTFTPQEHMQPQGAEASTRAMRDLLRSYRVDYVLASSQQAKWGVLSLVDASSAELRWLRTLPTAGVCAPLGQARPGE